MATSLPELVTVVSQYSGAGKSLLTILVCQRPMLLKWKKLSFKRTANVGIPTRNVSEGLNVDPSLTHFEVRLFDRESYSYLMKWYSYLYSNKAIRVRVRHKLSTSTKGRDFQHHLVFPQSKSATSKLPQRVIVGKFLLAARLNA